jgi:arylsulfatase A-like enzyme
MSVQVELAPVLPATPRELSRRDFTAVRVLLGCLLLVNAGGTGAELYDLATDPKETKDLAADKPDVVERLKKLCLDWRPSLP